MDSWVVALCAPSKRRGLSTAHAENVSLCFRSSALTQEKARHYQRHSQLEESVLLLHAIPGKVLKSMDPTGVEQSCENHP